MRRRLFPKPVAEQALAIATKRSWFFDQFPEDAVRRALVRDLQALVESYGDD